LLGGVIVGLAVDFFKLSGDFRDLVDVTIAVGTIISAVAVAGGINNDAWM
jgi:hypothetical protein